VVRQAGVVSLAQAAAHGYSADRVHRRVREGRWRRLHPGVFLVGGHRLTDEARVRSAWLWAGEASVVAGPAAAHWHGMLARAANVVDLTVPSRVKPRPRAGVRLRRRDLAQEDVVALRGVRVVCAGLAALETAVALAEGPRSSTARCSGTSRSRTCMPPIAAIWDLPGRPACTGCLWPQLTVRIRWPSGSSSECSAQRGLKDGCWATGVGPTRLTVAQIVAALAAAS
jgi:Transcriptional regulator, AbiEi antitoxin